VRTVNVHSFPKILRGPPKPIFYFKKFQPFDNSNRGNKSICMAYLSLPPSSLNGSRLSLFELPSDGDTA